MADDKDSDGDIYSGAFVERLFDQMSGSYDRVNYLTSFGFSDRWRRQFVRRANLRPGMRVCDLMCGRGECWQAISGQMHGGGSLVALDFSEGMLHGARQRAQTLPLNIAVEKRDVFASGLPAHSVDAVVCGFGVKTLSEAQCVALAREIKRLLRPGGSFSLVEVSVPRPWLLRVLYLLYLKRCIPFFGRLLLGNPEPYRMLGVYTEKFGNCRALHDVFARHGLTATYYSYFLGCASGLSGTVPMPA